MQPIMHIYVICMELYQEITKGISNLFNEKIFTID